MALVAVVGLASVPIGVQCEAFVGGLAAISSGVQWAMSSGTERKLVVNDGVLMVRERPAAVVLVVLLGGG